VRSISLVPNKGTRANVVIAIFALGCASVFFTVGMIGGFNIATLVGVAILALFVLGTVCSAVYIVFTLVTQRNCPSQESQQVATAW
jgi:hypothetical protein